MADLAAAWLKSPRSLYAKSAAFGRTGRLACPYVVRALRLDTECMLLSSAQVLDQTGG
jgi:hypothetical protein